LNHLKDLPLSIVHQVSREKTQDRNLHTSTTEIFLVETAIQKMGLEIRLDNKSQSTITVCYTLTQSLSDTEK